MSPNITIVYFGLAGRAEPIRLAAVVGKLPFYNKAINFKDFGAMQQDKDRLPLGQLPLLEIEDERIGHKTIIPQTDAILRYVGKRTGLYPDDPLEALQVDSIMDTIKALEAPMEVTFMGPVKSLIADKEWEKDEKLAMRKRILEVAIPKYLGFLERKLTENGTGWLVGTSITIADLRLYFPCQVMIGNGILDGIPPESLDSYPNIKKCMAKISEIPEVVAWYEAHPGRKYGDFEHIPKA
mmetsp:Transcript_7780/g.12880  ORF Transcript_7780/g.12880 Transcript_7780/m.12880 type:complete len:239 (+) Transcript_7780:144-860(+)